jgi:hypothetical protein
MVRKKHTQKVLGVALWERVRAGRLPVADAMAVLRDREPKAYAALSTYKRLVKFEAAQRGGKDLGHG